MRQQYNITLKHYTTKSILNNWEVFLDGNKIGNVHDCDGIGGEIGEHTETDMFDEVCLQAQLELKKLRSTPEKRIKELKDEMVMKLIKEIEDLSAFDVMMRALYQGGTDIKIIDISEMNELFKATNQKCLED